jgi:hypothetical protein
MKSRLVAALIFALGACPLLAAQACPLTEQQFSDEVDRLTGWASIQAYQDRFFPPCADEGAYAQTHSELVARTLAARWGETAELAALLRASPAFRQFFFRHLNAQGGMAQLQAVLSYATFRCPRKEAALCSEIRQSAGRALEKLQ